MTQILETWTSHKVYLDINQSHHTNMANHYQSWMLADYSFNSMLLDTHHKIWALTTVCAMMSYQATL